jgi:hypothetical protein
MARAIAAIIAGTEVSEKPIKPKAGGLESPGHQSLATEIAAVKAAAMKTLAMKNRRHAPRHFQLRSTKQGQSLQELPSFNNLRVMRPSCSLPPSYHPICSGSPEGPARMISSNREGVGIAAGLGSDWMVAGDAISNGHPNKSLKPKLQFATEFTVAQAGIKGVARRSLSAWRGKPADPPRLAISSRRSTGPRLRSHQLERGPK